MNKKTIKAILDVIKDVEDRPGLYGAMINGRYITFTDGYLIVRLEMGEYEELRPFPMADKVWVSGQQLKEHYNTIKGREVLLSVRDDDHDNKQLNEPKVLHPDYDKLWETEWEGERSAEGTLINPVEFKKLAPFGVMEMWIEKRTERSDYIKFKGKGVEAIVCSMFKGGIK